MQQHFPGQRDKIAGTLQRGPARANLVGPVTVKSSSPTSGLAMFEADVTADADTMRGRFGPRLKETGSRE
jgi:hypothetical protein